MKYTLALYLLFFSVVSIAQEGNRSLKDLILESQNLALRNLLDSDSYNERNIVMVAEDGSRIWKSQKNIDDAMQIGSKHYREENYKEAFTALSEVAAMGNKYAQTIIGMMYLQGQHVPKSIVTGMGWLGVANETKNKTAKKAYKQVYSQLSDQHKKVIDETVAGYVSKYGMETQNINCKKVKAAGSNISQSICAKSAGSESPYYPVL